MTVSFSFAVLLTNWQVSVAASSGADVTTVGVQAKRPGPVSV